MRHLTLVPASALPARDVFGRDLHPRDYRRYLGQTRSALAWDASGGLYPNAFAALAATMYGTRHFDWYDLKKREDLS